MSIGDYNYLQCVSLLYVESHCILNQIVTKISNVQKKYDGLLCINQGYIEYRTSIWDHWRMCTTFQTIIGPSFNYIHQPAQNLQVRYNNCQVIFVHTYMYFFDLHIYRGEYNVENLKLSRDRHENCKTHPKGKNIFINLFFNNKRAL